MILFEPVSPYGTLPLEPYTIERSTHNAKPVHMIKISCGEVHTSFNWIVKTEESFSHQGKSTSLEMNYGVLPQVSWAKLNHIYSEKFENFNIQLATCKTYKFKCFKLLNINGQEKVYINKIVAVGYDDW